MKDYREKNHIQAMLHSVAVGIGICGVIIATLNEYFFTFFKI
jgi:hypothetical protein